MSTHHRNKVHSIGRDIMVWMDPNTFLSCINFLWSIHPCKSSNQKYKICILLLYNIDCMELDMGNIFLSDCLHIHFIYKMSHMSHKQLSSWIDLMHICHKQECLSHSNKSITDIVLGIQYITYFLYKSLQDTDLCIDHNIKSFWNLNSCYNMSHFNIKDMEIDI